MTTLTIIKDDSWVSIDGVPFFDIDCSSLAANVHAIQWDGSNGWIEYNDGTPNEDIDSIAAYSIITDLHATAKATEDSDNATQLAANEIKEATYGFKRVNDATTKYGTIEDQLDQQYHDAIDGTTTWKDGITAVKTAHPK